MKILSKLLGTLVILGGVGFKLPQILKIAKNKSAEGIALSQYALELLISANTLSFNYHIDAPFSTYGESFFILLQNVVIVFQIAYYRSMAPATFIGGWAAYLLIIAFLYSEFSRDLKLEAPVCSFSNGLSCKIAPAAFQDILQVRPVRGCARAALSPERNCPASSPAPQLVLIPRPRPRCSAPCSSS